MIRELNDRPVLFVIFAAQYELSRAGWSEQSLTDQFVQHGVSFISNRTLVEADMHRTGSALDVYFIPGDGHPSVYQTRLVAMEMKRQLLGSVLVTGKRTP